MRTLLKILCAVLLLVVLNSGEARAVTCAANAVCLTGAYTLTPSDGTTPATLYTATGNGAAVYAIYCTTPQLYPFPPLMSIFLKKSGTSYLLASVQFAGTAGENTSTPNMLFYKPPSTVGQPLLNVPIDGNSNPYVWLGSGDAIQIGVQSAISSGNSISCIAQVVQF